MSISNLKKLAAVAVVASSGFISMQASATILGYGDAYYLGAALPGTPSDEGTEAVFINKLLDLAPEGTVACGPHPSVCTRADSTLVATSLPDAIVEADTENVLEDNWTFDVSSSSYLVGKYGQDSYIWYVGDLNSVTLTNKLFLGTYDDKGKPVQTGGLSHWALFGPTTEVPEPATLGLLGLGLVGTAIARRRRK